MRIFWGHGSTRPTATGWVGEGSEARLVLPPPYLRATLTKSPPAEAAAAWRRFEQVGRIPRHHTFIPQPDRNKMKSLNRTLQEFLQIVEREKIGITLPSLQELKRYLFYTAFTRWFIPSTAEFEMVRFAASSVQSLSFREFAARSTHQKADIERIAEDLLARNSRPRPWTTLILGAGRDKSTIETALRRGDSVIVVDRDPQVTDWLREHPPSRTKLRILRVSYSDPLFMRAYFQQVDLVYLLYTSDPTHMATLMNLVRPGGVVVTEDPNDCSELYRKLCVRNLPEADREFENWELFNGLPPLYDTPWSRLFPTGNSIGIYQRRPDSTTAGRYFFTFPDKTLRRFEDLCRGGTVPYSECLKMGPLDYEVIST